MGEQKEYKKFDSHTKVSYVNARLAKDAESRDGEHGKMVRLTTVATSRKESYADLWLEVNVGDFHAELASFLKKGDTVSLIYGQLCKRTYGDDNEKSSIIVDRAEVTLTPDLMAECKARGWVPGQKSGAAKPDAKKKGAKPVPAAKPAAKKAKPAPVEIPDEDPDDGDSGDDDGGDE